MPRQSSPVAIEIAWSRIASIADEADANVARTAFSSIIRDSHDYSCGLYDARGNLLSQPTTVAPAHLGGMTAAMKVLGDYFPFETLREGDAIVTNDPWIMSGHLPDIMVVMPVFHRGRLVAHAGSVFHHQDVGGHLGTDTREVFEEGLQIPPCMLYRAGQANEDIFRIIAQNVRVPELVINDLKSQVASLHFTAERICSFLQEQDLEELESLADEIYARTETAVRRGIEKIPDGVYEAEKLLDLGPDEPSVRLKLRLEVAGDELLADFAGTGPQIERGVNCVLNYTTAYLLFGVMSLVAPFLPSNAGAVRPLRIAAPEGCILNAQRPAPVIGRTAIGQNIPELVFSALSSVLPEDVIAESGSLPLWWLTLSGQRAGGEPFVVGPMFSGGLGARSGSDGVSTLTFPTNIMNNPVEAMESESPLLVERRELVEDSAGAGRYRGGLGQEFVVRVPDDDAAPARPVVNFLVAGRTVIGPRGLFGGADAPPATIEVNGRAIGWGRPYLLEPGDRIAYRTAGGGGYGDPKERDRDKVREDLRNGLVSPQAARDVYGMDDPS